MVGDVGAEGLGGPGKQLGGGGGGIEREGTHWKEEVPMGRSLPGKKGGLGPGSVSSERLPLPLSPV